VFNRGNAEVFIDGESRGTVSQYDEGNLFQQSIWKITDLPDGEHTIKIVNLTEYTCLDAFFVYTSGVETEPETEPDVKPNMDIIVNDNDPAVVYEGEFTYDQGAPANEYGTGDVHYTNMGGSIEYTFTGTGIAWIGQKVFNRGDAVVFIDGESQGMISQYDEQVLYAQLVWMINDLPEGEHTILIVNWSQYTCVDCFIVNPSFVPEVEPDTDPVEPETDPVEPETDPVESDTNPVEPETDPVESDTDTVEPNTDPVEPETEPVESETNGNESDTDTDTEEVTSSSVQAPNATGTSSGCKSSICFGSLSVLLTVIAFGFSIESNTI
jgi:hypothetical protein